MTEDRETARLLGRLRRHAESWLESNQHKDHLLRGALLIQMEELVQNEGSHVGDLAQSFLLASQTLRESEQRQQRRRVQGTIFAAVATTLITFLLFLNANQAKNEARQSETSALQAEALASAKTRESNYNLSMAFNERAGIALDKNRPREAWLGALAALAQDIPQDRDNPEARGRFLDSRMGKMGRLLWTSPVAPKLLHVATSHDGDILVLGARNTHIYLMDTTTGRQEALFTSANHSLLDLKISPNKQWLAAATEGQEIHIWDLKKQNLHSIHKYHREAIQSIAFPPDNKHLASVDSSGKLTLLSLLDSSTQDYKLPQGTRAITFGQDNEKIYLASPKGIAAYRFSDQNLQIYKSPLQSQSTALAWNAKLGLISGWSQGEIVFHQSPAQSLIGKNRHQNAVLQFATRIWRLSDNKTQMVLRGHTNKLGWYAAFSPDSAFLATPSDDHTVRLWQMDKMLVPPKDSDSQQWYQELLKRSLYFMAYRRDGFQLIPQAHTRLGHRADTPAHPI